MQRQLEMRCVRGPILRKLSYDACRAELYYMYWDRLPCARCQYNVLQYQESSHPTAVPSCAASGILCPRGRPLRQSQKCGFGTQLLPCSVNTCCGMYLARLLDRIILIWYWFLKSKRALKVSLIPYVLQKPVRRPTAAVLEFHLPGVAPCA
jgi:hypothetical protein